MYRDVWSKSYKKGKQMAEDQIPPTTLKILGLPAGQEIITFRTYCVIKES